MAAAATVQAGLANWCGVLPGLSSQSVRKILTEKNYHDRTGQVWKVAQLNGFHRTALYRVH